MCIPSIALHAVWIFDHESPEFSRIREEVLLLCGGDLRVGLAIPFQLSIALSPSFTISRAHIRENS